jgi:hypothetical protein
MHTRHSFALVNRFNIANHHFRQHPRGQVATTNLPKGETTMNDKISSTVVVTTSIVIFISGFLLGIYSIRGYLISPALASSH